MVKRYVAAMIRDAKTEEGLTEENFKVRGVFLFVFFRVSMNLVELLSLKIICYKT